MFYRHADKGSEGGPLVGDGKGDFLSYYMVHLGIGREGIYV